MTLHYAQTIFEGLKAYRQPDGSVATFRPEANADASSAPPAGSRCPSCRSRPSSRPRRARRARTRRGCPRRRRGSPCTCGPSCSPPRSASACARANEYLFVVIASPAGAYFPAASSRSPSGFRGLRPRRPGGTGDGQVRRQLRRLPGRPGPGRRAGLRPGRLARRDRAPLDRGDGRHEPVLRVRRTDDRHPRAHRLPAARASPATRCCSIAARPRLRGGARAASPSTSGAATPRTAAHRGLRLRHRGGHHARRHGQARRRRVDQSATASPARSRCGSARRCWTSRPAAPLTRTAGCTSSSDARVSPRPDGPTPTSAP